MDGVIGIDMKRKLIKRNKQLLSKGYKYKQGYGAFRIVARTNVYFTKEGKVVFKARRYYNMWTYSDKAMDEILKYDDEWE